MTEGLHRFYGGRDLHFLTFSCYQRQPLFNSAARCDLFLQILERIRCRYRLVVLGYVVMPEHVHLLVSEPQRANLSIAIQALKLGVVRSLIISGEETAAAVTPRSRKRSETWAPPVQMVVGNLVASGKRDSMTSMSGLRRNESKSCAIFIAIRSCEDSWSRRNSGSGAAFGGIYRGR
jgi:REP element-mobilizing transposase RayT